MGMLGRMSPNLGVGVPHLHEPVHTTAERHAVGACAGMVGGDNPAHSSTGVSTYTLAQTSTDTHRHTNTPHTRTRANTHKMRTVEAVKGEASYGAHVSTQHNLLHTGGVGT